MAMIQTSAWEAFLARAGLRVRDRRLAKREAAVVHAVAEVDIDLRLLPEEMRRFVRRRVEREAEAWRRGELDGLAELFHRSRDRGDAGRHRIELTGGPIARLQWATRDSDDGPWRFVMLVGVQVGRTATSWRVARSDLGSNEWELLTTWWTLVADGDGWKLVQVESQDRGYHYRRDRLPNAPRDEDLHDDATIALAGADRASATDVVQLADADEPVRARLLDLSLLDGRYAPDAIAACVGEIVRAWEGATEREERAELERWSTHEALDQLTRPTPNGMRRVRNLELCGVRITALDSDGAAPRVAVEVHLHGLRWLASVHGAHTPISGNDLRDRSFTEHWTLDLHPDGDAPWRVTDVERPGRR
jgi:hypothetical protein